MTDPRTEHPDVTRARALASLDTALSRIAGVSDADKAMLRDMVLPAWQEWVAAMQRARLDDRHAYQQRAAALMLMVNVFWETVVMTTAPHMVAPVSERLLAQVLAAIREGPCS